jgi:hypothetical protein
MGKVGQWSASFLEIDVLATDRRKYAGIQISSIRSTGQPIAASADDLWQFCRPECLQVSEAVSNNIGVPTSSSSAA